MIKHYITESVIKQTQQEMVTVTLYKENKNNSNVCHTIPHKLWSTYRSPQEHHDTSGLVGQHHDQVRRDSSRMGTVWSPQSQHTSSPDPSDPSNH